MKTRTTLDFTELTEYAAVAVALRDVEDHQVIQLTQGSDTIWVRLEDFDQMLKQIAKWWEDVPS